MSKIRTAVVGVGYLGKFHAQKYAALPDSELVAVCDQNPENAEKIAKECHTRAETDYHNLIGQVEAVSIVVPTQLHYKVAKTFLENGVHVLLEKPITATVAEAQELVDIANRTGVIFQIGHLERFNPAILALEGVLNQPRFIESHRVAPFNPRGADVNVILDLMIHDIDIILDIANSPVKHIDANGVAVLSKDIDLANARIQFENGCVANVTASRAGMKSERKMRLVQDDAYITIDFQNKKLGIHRKGSGEMYPGIANIESQEQAFEQGDALLAEITSFLKVIQTGTTPVVSGEDGKRALETAMAITTLLQTNRN
ncbi:MAG: Gfo/Idh/MocA family oxidoreductase [Gammaproteobacteria bacterium]|nr:Gfo/Idh/MocA family oxidoreductase [Gammaproteobacteria bacterium]MDH5652832.1 Gfo/Idh/MocA family oxidoreductase [Gammaproteobacteria bacterium]